MPARPELWGAQRYFAWLYSPPRLRAALEALLAIESEIRSALGRELDHGAAHLRLGWWREECERYTRGAAIHPLMRALHATSAGADRSPSGLVDAAVWDLAAATFASRAELSTYCEHWASAVTRIAAEAAVTDGVPRVAAGQFGRSLGIALREIELTANLATDARSGRLRVPLDELEQAGVAPDMLARPPWPSALGALLGTRLRELRTELAASIAALPAESQPSLRGLIVWAALARRQAERLEQALPQPASIGRGARAADAWLAWRVARRAERAAFAFATEVVP
jgi:15-cis-phytoene synthase